MIRFFAEKFVLAFAQLQHSAKTSQLDRVRDGHPEVEPEWRTALRERLDEMAVECKAAGLDELEVRCFVLKRATRNKSVASLADLLEDLSQDIVCQLTGRVFFWVPGSRKDLYHEGDYALFGEEVATAIPGTTPEAAEAGRCFALGRWTACVFHLMRATELALHKWADDLGLDLKVPASQADMNVILRAADTKLREIENSPRSAQRDADLAYFGDTSAYFRAIKDAWRNHVAHARATYDEERALSIMNNVKSFMQTLAKRPNPSA